MLIRFGTGCCIRCNLRRDRMNVLRRRGEGVLYWLLNCWFPFVSFDKPMRSVDACMIGRGRSQSPWTLTLHDCVACGRTSYYLIKYTPNSVTACPLLEIIVLETRRTNVQLQEYRVDKCVDKAGERDARAAERLCNPGAAWVHQAPA